MFQELIRYQYCFPDIKESGKTELLRRMAELAAKFIQKEEIKENVIYNAILEREKQGSTGFGRGVAIPHAGLKELKHTYLFVFTSRKGIDFDAVDHKKVQLFFMLIGPENAADRHIKILATLARMLNSQPLLKRELLQCNSAGSLYEVFIRSYDRHETDKNKLTRMKLLTIILYMQEYLHDILQFLIEEGVEGATILDSTGMAEYISNIPIFMSFVNFLNEDRYHSKTIIALIPETREQAIVEGIEMIVGNLDKMDGAMIMIQDVSFYKGSMKMY
ncbi:PTS sugar transporter subunit IIA [bacterium]|nr:PTS sugar transporter subunit IIA [bacterium]